MTAAMDPDAWNWSPSEVQDFFRHYAANLIHDMPHSRLPPLETLVNAFAENDVNGVDLLKGVDKDFLKDECGIKSFSHRNTVMLCIGKLQARSRLYRGQNGDHSLDTPLSVTPAAFPDTATPMLSLPAPPSSTDGQGGVLNQSPGRPASASPTARGPAVPFAIGENIRYGETEVQDGRGRKRRKLYLTGPRQSEPSAEEPLASSANSPATAQEEDHLPGYLPGYKLPIDEVFYGGTKFGEEIARLPATSAGAVFRATDSDSDEDNFHFYRRKDAHFPGQADYVYPQLKHFLMIEDTKPLRRHNRDALAIFPYRNHLAEKRSATVFQFRGKDRVVAVREYEAILDSADGKTAEEQQQLTGEWDFLLQNHRAGSQDEVLPEYGGSEFGGNKSFAITETGTKTELEEDGGLAEEEGGDATPKPETWNASDIIQEAVDKLIVDWRERKLPNLEVKQAWKVWKQPKRSRTLRDQLTHGAMRIIGQFEKRLAAQKIRFLEATWTNKDELLAACQIMEPTIHDREEQKWKIQVWKRREDPAHTAQHHASSDHMQQHQSTAQGPSSTAQLAQALRDLGTDDQFSVSPQPQSSRLPMPQFTDDQEEFHTPPGSPARQGADAEDSDDAADDADESDQFSDRGVAESDDEEPADTSMQDVNEHESLVELAGQGLGSSDAHKIASPSNSPQNVDTPGLPSPSTFYTRTAKLEPSTPTKPARANNTVVISLLSSDESAQKKKSSAVKINRKNASPASNPDDATAAEVDSWDYGMIEDSTQRTQLLIKMLRDAGPEVRDQISKRLLASSTPFKENLIKEIIGFTTTEADHAGAESKIPKPMFHAARMAIAWYLCKPAIRNANSLPQEYSDRLDELLSGSLLSQFVSLLKSYVALKKNSKLFVEHPKTSASKPLEILSDDEDNAEGLQETPLASARKKRKPVEMSQAALGTRQAAHVRQKMHEEAVQSQAMLQSKSDPRRLEQMIASDPSYSEIEINPAREPEQPPIYIPPHIARKMKDHQVTGVRFMWRELTANEEDGAQGCLLAHTMGLGKTMQSITLLVTVAEAVQSKEKEIRKQLPKLLRPKDLKDKRHLRVLILCPPGLIQNWRKEFGIWDPKQKTGDILAVESGNNKEIPNQLKSWEAFGGILLIGYPMFRMQFAEKKRVQNKAELATTKWIQDVLLDKPELIIADEVHNLKSDKSAVSVAADKFKCGIRIALTGTPMSNVVQEIYSIINWAAPGYLGSREEFRSHYAIPIEAGNDKDAFPSEKRESTIKLAMLRDEIEPKVSRAGIEVLKGSLKPKVEFVITVPLTQTQLEAYRKCVTALTAEGRNADAAQVTIFGWLAVLMLLTNHPWAYRKKLLEVPKQKPKKKKGRGPTPPSAEDDIDGSVEPQQPDDNSVVDEGEDPVEKDVYSLGFTKPIIDELLCDLSDDTSPDLSAKMTVFLDILRLSKQCKDKVLVFSTSIPTLNYVEILLKQEGFYSGRIDGSVAVAVRTKLIEDFHANKYDIMLISTKAGGVGLNIQGANRVIILDFGFNPTNEEQAVGRAYRLGQQKPVFVYRFVAGGTFETSIYNKQLFKSSLSLKVVDKRNPKRAKNPRPHDYLKMPKEVPEEDVRAELGKDPQVLDKIIEKQYSSAENPINIRAVRTMETLQEETPDELDEQGALEVVQGRQRRQDTRKGRMGGMMTSSAMPGPSQMYPPTATAAAQASQQRHGYGTQPPPGIGGLPYAPTQ